MCDGGGDYKKCMDLGGIKKRILCATSRRDFRAKLQDIMDDCGDSGDATTHKHSLPQRLLLYLYVQGYNFEISKVKEKKGYMHILW